MVMVQQEYFLYYVSFMQSISTSKLFHFIHRCIDKVFMEEQTKFDAEITCQHSYDKRCAKSLVTVYNAAQV